MRVLCLDPGGILGSPPSPVLFPEYGERFVHVPDLGGDHAEAVADFLHSGQSTDWREIWVLWKPGDELYVIERVSSQLAERLKSEKGLAVYGVLLAHVESGSEKHSFFDSNRSIEELLHFSGHGNGRPPGWHTLLLGYRTGSGVASAPVALMMPALSLRCWLDRKDLSPRWDEPDYRALVEFHEESYVNPLILSMGKCWQEAFSSLRAKADKLRDDPCESSQLGNPTISFEAFPDNPDQQALSKKLLCFLRGFFPLAPAECLTGFLQDRDREIAYRWVGRLFDGLSETIESAWADSKKKFDHEVGQIHNVQGSGGCATTDRTPQQALADLEQELDGLSELDAGHHSSPNVLREKIAGEHRNQLALLLAALRCRPTRTQFLGWTTGASVLVLGFAMFQAQAGLQSSAFELAIWPVAALLMLLLAVAWGLWRAQEPVRQSRDQAWWASKALWNEAGKLFSGEIELYKRELKRIVVFRNLETVRAEAATRNQKLAQIEYHINRLNAYSKAYGGGELSDEGVASQALQINYDRPESENEVYQWRASGVRVVTNDLPDPNAPKHWDNKRLAGVSRFSVKAIAPIGRQLEGINR